MVRAGLHEGVQVRHGQPAVGPHRPTGQQQHGKQLGEEEEEAGGGVQREGREAIVVKVNNKEKEESRRGDMLVGMEAGWVCLVHAPYDDQPSAWSWRILIEPPTTTTRHQHTSDDEEEEEPASTARLLRQTAGCASSRDAVVCC